MRGGRLESAITLKRSWRHLLSLNLITELSEILRKILPHRQLIARDRRNINQLSALDSKRFIHTAVLLCLFVAKELLRAIS